MTTPAAAAPALDPELTGLAVALAVGLLIGLEQGWRERALPEGGRVAGWRSFALIGLYGGVSVVLLQRLGAGGAAGMNAAPALLALAWVLMGLGLTALLIRGYRQTVGRTGDLSATPVLAALLTYALGALAAAGAPALAAAGAVIVALLLDLKPTLHGWLQRIEHPELSAALQLGVLSVVILPWLPDRGYGPYAALNPYRLWWAVVLVSGLSLAGHVAMRLGGARRGALWTGLIGGLSSSTAATLALVLPLDLTRGGRTPARQAAAVRGIVAACGVMALRLLLIVVTLQPALAVSLGAPLAAAGALLLAVSLGRWPARSALGMWAGGRAGASVDPAAAAPAATPEPVATAPVVAAPYDLSLALGFAAFLGVMAVLTQAAHQVYGTTGLYGVALLTGLADVDALTINVARMQATGELGDAAARGAVALAVMTNLVSKSAMAAWFGGLAVGWPVLLAQGAALVLAVLVAVVV
jgi:uncharacterized membrane protein (DUF4010 family)